MQETMVIVKPHAVPIWQDVLGYLDEQLQGKGRIKMRVYVPSVEREVISAHYQEHAGKPWYDLLVNQFLGNSVKLGIIESDEEIIPRVREICGPTDPAIARVQSPASLRARFTADSLELARLEKRAVNNVIHSPDSRSSAQRELSIWSQYF